MIWPSKIRLRIPSGRFPRDNRAHAFWTPSWSFRCRTHR
jgi:hypothetical protein